MRTFWQIYSLATLRSIAELEEDSGQIWPRMGWLFQSGIVDVIDEDGKRREVQIRGEGLDFYQIKL